jgi:hypothetical protein
MKSIKSLEELFEQAKMQKPLLDSNKVKEIIRLRTYKSQKINKLINMKIIIISSILTTAVGINHYLAEKDKSSIIERNLIELNASLEMDQSQTSKESNITESVNSIVLNDLGKITTLQNVFSNYGNKDKEFTEPDLEKTNLEKLEFSEDSTVQLPLQEGEVNTGNSKNQCIVLDKKELSQLGIYVKDGIFMFEQDKTPWGKVSATLFKDKRFSYSTTRQGLNKGNNPLPLFASSPEGKILFKLHVLADKKSDLEDLQNIASLSLPIWIDVEGSNYKSVIVWFKNDQYIKNILPEKFRTILTNEPGFYSNNVRFDNTGISTVSDISEKEESAEINYDTNHIVDPSLELLKKLDIKNEKGIRFKRKTGTCVMKIKMNDSEQLIDVTFCRKQTESKDIAKIVPSHVTVKNKNGSISYNTFRKENMNVNDKTSLINEQENLIALRIQKQSSNDEEILFWYQYTKAIANELGPLDKERIEKLLKDKKELKVKNLTINTLNETSIPYAEIALTDNVKKVQVKTVTLNIEEMKSLGISVVDKKIKYSIPTINNDKYSVNEFTINKYGTEINIIQKKEKPDTSNFLLPVFVTDLSGNYMRLSIDKMDVKSVALSTLIPVQVVSGDNYTTEDKIKNRHQPDLIFWYEPNSQFLSKLDSYKANELSNDVEALVCKQKHSIFSNSPKDSCSSSRPMSCNYFESCENKLNKKIIGYKVYPNPTSKDINIDLLLNNKGAIQFYLFTMDGKLIYEQINNSMQEGKQHIKLDNNKLTPGVYLLQILSENGDKIVERVVVGE